MSWLSDQALKRLRAAAQMPDVSGTRYRVLEPLGRGGMGVVYLAEDTRLDRRVALKVIDVPDASGELAARLLREAQILARLEHPGIVPVHDVGTLADGRVFYTMKFVQGRRLDQHLEQVESLPDRLRIFQKLCEAVAFAHAHEVLHRDLKPGNIMVGPFGEVLVMDWGLAKILRRSPAEPGEAVSRAELFETDLSNGASPTEQPPREESSTFRPAWPGETAHGIVLGTPGYMAPEQARGEISKLDARTDVFALGAILHFLLTGRPPGDLTRPEAGRASVPRALVAIANQAMSPEHAKRYATAQELAADIARHLDGLGVAAYPEGVFSKVWRLIVRHRVAVILVLAYLLMRVLLLVLFRR